MFNYERIERDFLIADLTAENLKAKYIQRYREAMRFWNEVISGETENKGSLIIWAKMISEANVLKMAYKMAIVRRDLLCNSLNEVGNLN